jgi:hypothetical protein
MAVSAAVASAIAAAVSTAEEAECPASAGAVAVRQWPAAAPEPGAGDLAAARQALTARQMLLLAGAVVAARAAADFSDAAASKR